LGRHGPEGDNHRRTDRLARHQVPQPERLGTLASRGGRPRATPDTAMAQGMEGERRDAGELAYPRGKVDALTGQQRPDSLACHRVVETFPLPEGHNSGPTVRREKASRTKASHTKERLARVQPSPNLDRGTHQSSGSHVPGARLEGGSG